jgi:hypothetical protein
VVGGLVSLETRVYHARYSDSTMLPTFSITLPNGHRIRGLKDYGCQSNFICKSAAVRENLPVVNENFYLTVNGFNSSKSFVASVVELSTDFGSNRRTFHAVVVPELQTRLKLPGLTEVVDTFVQKGYKLADDFC